MTKREKFTFIGELLYFSTRLLHSNIGSFSIHLQFMYIFIFVSKYTLACIYEFNHKLKISIYLSITTITILEKENVPCVESAKKFLLATTFARGVP